ncbi:MAG: 3-dehydroquinate synthase [Gemmatimonadetes bacterium 13_2_20CM_1_70_33]|nr:MAG: 3-dehydroquinate synthase [Gemmatimonadetes bacterium 13_2_20CM_1_70_33]
MVKLRVAISEQRDASYDIVIGRGLLADLPAFVKAACPAGRYVVITDSHVAKLYGKQVMARFHDAKLQVESLEFPAGERNKTRETWALLSDRMLAAQIGRDSAVIALGGGVVGDVAGFVAATYLRGIPCVQVPTTLLAMIDSSIGGKTGVDVPAGKNLLGAFHQPRLVVADLDVLGSLPPPQLAAGMAEAVKHGVIADRQYFDVLEQEHAAVTTRDVGALERVVRRSVEIKAEVVAADEREAGRRAILNFGHTVAHAIEATTKFATLHGEAVAIGMAYEARLAEALGIAEAGTADRVQRLLERYNLPLDLPESATVDALVAAMQLDKKVRDGSVRFALPQTIGRMYADGKSWTVAAPENVVRDVLGEPQGGPV